MKTTLLAAILAAGLLAAAASGGTDPRKCAYSTSTKVCTQAAAVAALKATMSRRDHVGWDADISCTGTSPRFLLWRCTFKNAVENGSATIAFRALSNGWHTQVTTG